jgi:hypothetical protein
MPIHSVIYAKRSVTYGELYMPRDFLWAAVDTLEEEPALGEIPNDGCAVFQGNTFPFVTKVIPWDHVHSFLIHTAVISRKVSTEVVLTQILTNLGYKVM